MKGHAPRPIGTDKHSLGYARLFWDGLKRLASSSGAAASVVAVMMTAGCAVSGEVSGAPPEAQEIGLAECGVCGMTVSEQPAPRAQVAHRKGAAVFFCSLGDLRAYLQTPSPRGRVTATWVEVLEDDFEPASMSTELRPWLPAPEAVYVVGVDRPGVMGPAAMSFATSAAAQRQLQLPGARTVPWNQIRDAPFTHHPPSLGPETN